MKAVKYRSTLVLLLVISVVTPFVVYYLVLNIIQFVLNKA